MDKKNNPLLNDEALKAIYAKVAYAWNDLDIHSLIEVWPSIKGKLDVLPSRGARPPSAELYLGCMQIRLQIRHGANLNNLHMSDFTGGRWRVFQKSNDALWEALHAIPEGHEAVARAMLKQKFGTDRPDEIFATLHPAGISDLQTLKAQIESGKVTKLTRGPK